VLFGAPEGALEALDEIVWKPKIEGKPRKGKP
jgi:hypothetical protein